ncbi:MAG: hypothetical protein REI94_10220 [Moraxellaceae bacterium]|nr:hypothetical protein [Moraxellaceae bacterium]
MKVMWLLGVAIFFAAAFTMLWQIMMLEHQPLMPPVQVMDHQTESIWRVGTANPSPSAGQPSDAAANLPSTGTD